MKQHINMPTFQEFLSKQDGIYAQFRNTEKVRSEGVKKGFQPQGGYLIVFRHTRAIAEPIEEFAARISRLTPAIAYHRENLHTTITDYQLTPLDQFSPDSTILHRLSQAVHASLPLQAPAIQLGDWLYNQTGVILQGTPDEQFFRTAESILANSKQAGIELRLPWGAHSTTDRFTRERKPEQLEDFFELMKSAPVLGETKPAAIDVGYFNLGDIFTLHVHERFPLRNP